MENYCMLCGDVLETGTTTFDHHQFKKMCLNCAYAHHVDDSDITSELVCTNEVNRSTVAKKMIDAASAVTEAYSVDDIKISPLPLKKPTGKCKQWILDDTIRENLVNLFV